MASDNPELLEIFLEEATDLLATISNILREWETDLNNLNKITDLKRELHTLKGSARMVGQTAVATLTHEIETLADALAKGQIKVEKSIFDQMGLGVDQISAMIDTIRNNETPAPAESLIEKFHAYLAGEGEVKGERAKASEAKDAGAKDAEAKDTEAKEAKKEGELETTPPSQAASQEALGKTAGEAQAKTESAKPSAEIIRIRASLLETLNNLSAENTMIRVGIEQHVYSNGDYLRKLKQSVKQLDSQLSILNTDASILLSKRRLRPFIPVASQTNAIESGTGLTAIATATLASPVEPDFNPVEESTDIVKEIMMDLKNSVGGLSDMQTQLESLLLHQNRITSELQHRLAETRLTPFESIVPRLSRIARQVANELQKQVDFRVNKTQGEMDRTILEHLIPSLEHILRNAIDHGIESSEQRKKLGKPETGKIEVNFIRSGSIAAIQIRDDGSGINAEAVRNKAIKLGLLKPEEKISDQEVVRYILEPGFSTREAVTQVSGRGVGMDVVNTAVNELGGTLLIDSIPGKGTTFTVRFPFTSSLNRILLFTLAGETFGITLTGIEGVTSIEAKEMKEQCAKQPALFRQGNKGYYLHYLSSVLNPELTQVQLPLKNSYPIILISSPLNSIAVIVDSILYSRDLLVQALGAQFKLTEEFSGATLLGDGRAVLILDPESLTRKAKMLEEKENLMIDFAKSVGVHEKKSIRVMIVDDSASARAVLQQSLERHHYHILTAEDGAEALLKLQTLTSDEELPDILLLDIDMPRMNGIELATKLRQSDRFKHIPIAILTADATSSRREQAKELQVEIFLEKPIDELQIIAALQVLARKAKGIKGI